METAKPTPALPDCCSIVELPEPVAATAAAPQSVRVVEILNPFRAEESHAVAVDPLDNESVGALLVRHGFQPERFEISLSGEPLASDLLWNTTLPAGAELVLFPRAGGGNFWKGIGMMLLGITVGLLSWGIGLYVGVTYLGMTFTQASLLGAAIGMVGNLLISWALAPGVTLPTTPAYSLTYDPTGPKGLAQPGVPVPKAYGVMGWCGNIVSSFVDYDGHDAYIYALACYGFGKAKAISNILLNGKPISQYNQCTYQIRLGSNTQTPIDGFNRTINGYPQQTQLLCTHGAVTVSGQGTNVQGLQVTVKFPGGLYWISSDGNCHSLKLIYTISISEHGQNNWFGPLFPKDTKNIATTNPDGTQSWPTWVVAPTDRFAGCGLVYAYDNGPHTVGDIWSQDMTVTTVTIDGGTVQSTQSFQGKWQPCDPSLEQVMVTTWQDGYRIVQNNVISAIFDTASIYGLSAGCWDVQVAKVGYQQDDGSYIQFQDSPDAQHICDVWLWNINEVRFSDLSYPNMILVGVQALATSQLSGQNFQITATIDHDLGEDTVLPPQLVNFAHDNPALVAYDVLTNPLYGMGVSASLIDIPAFTAWAEFCDELVQNQDGSMVRRFLFNGVFDQSSDAWKILQSIGSMSRAAIIPMGLRYTVVIDAPAEPVQLFTGGNMKKDTIQESWLALDERTTLIECDFADAARNYRTDLPVSVMTSADLNSGMPPKPTRTKLLGCTSRDQAWRWSYFHLLSTKLSLRTLQFEAAVEACCCRPGSVIAVQSDVTQWASGGRILEGSTLNTVVIDRNDLTFSSSSGYTVSVQHPLVHRGSGAVLAVSGQTVTMAAALPAGRILKAVAANGAEYIVTGASGSCMVFSTAPNLVAGQSLDLYDLNVIEMMQVEGYAPNAFGATLSILGAFQAAPVADCPWAYGPSAGYQPARLFRVTNMKRSGDLNFLISSLEYNAIGYEDVTPNYGEIIDVPDTKPFITNFTLTEQYQNGALTGSKNSSLVCVGWMNQNTAVGAQIMVKAGDGEFNQLGNIQGQGCSFVGMVGVTYTVRATGFNWAGALLGSPVVDHLTVCASANAPEDVTGFTGYAANNTVGLTWNAANGADHYEIRYAPSGAANWITAEILWSGNATSWADTTIRSGVYMIVAVGPKAEGSIDSKHPATWSKADSTPTTPTNVIFSSLIWPMTGISNGKGIANAPYGTAVLTDGFNVSIPQQSLSFVLPVAGQIPSTQSIAAYYAYLYLDTNFVLRTVNGTPVSGVVPAGALDYKPNAGHGAAAKSAGVLAWFVGWALDINGNLLYTIEPTVI